LHSGLRVLSASNRNEYQIISGSKAWAACKTGTLTTICEPLSRKCGILDGSQPCRPPWSVTGIALFKVGGCYTFTVFHQNPWPINHSNFCIIKIKWMLIKFFIPAIYSASYSGKHFEIIHTKWKPSAHQDCSVIKLKTWTIHYNIYFNIKCTWTQTWVL
jgi:hypothetical protein